ncbi:MAG: hypothetical protein V4692_00365, partial [Bdellovibrionota bacterium]
LDLPLAPLNAALEAEAVSVGAAVLESSTVAARSDVLWVAECFGVQLDPNALTEALNQARKV